MDLRHLRYFIAVAEEGSLTVAAERRLHTAQPSLSRQLRDLEQEVGVALMTRSVRGIVLTAAGEAFLDHARAAVAQAEAAISAARRAATPSRPAFAVGFLTGQEMDWLPEAMIVLKDDLPRIDVTVSSQYSPELADALVRGTLDLAFLRPEQHHPSLVYRRVATEPLRVVLAADHRLASRTTIAILDLAGEPFIGMSATAPSLQRIIDDYLKREGVTLRKAHEIDNLGMAVSLVVSTRGVTLLPAYAENFLPGSVVSRPLSGVVPGIDLVIGYDPNNRSPILQRFLSRVDDLIALVARKARHDDVIESTAAHL